MVLRRDSENEAIQKIIVPAAARNSHLIRRAVKGGVCGGHSFNGMLGSGRGKAGRSRKGLQGDVD